MEKRISPGIIISFLASCLLMLAPYLAPSGMGINFLYFLLSLCGLWLFILTVCFLPFKGKPGKIAKMIRRVILVLSAFGLVIFLSAEAYIFAGSKPDYSEDYDAVIILGAGLYGETPSAALYSRLHAGRDALYENPDSLAVLTGGQGPGESITEAEAMGRYLESQRISDERILLEKKADSTATNLEYSKEILDAEFGVDNYRVLIVTNEFHIARSLLLAERLGIAAEGRAAPTPDIGLMPLSSWLREGFALVAAVVSPSR